jgi:hypothetical protein
LRQLAREVRLTEQIPGEVLQSDKMPPSMPARDSGRGAPAAALAAPNGAKAPPPPPGAGAGSALGRMAPPPPPPPPPAAMQAQPAPERGMAPPARAITPDTAMRVPGMNPNLRALPSGAGPPQP